MAGFFYDWQTVSSLNTMVCSRPLPYIIINEGEGTYPHTKIAMSPCYTQSGDATLTLISYSGAVGDLQIEQLAPVEGVKSAQWSIQVLASAP